MGKLLASLVLAVAVLAMIAELTSAACCNSGNCGYYNYNGQSGCYQGSGCQSGYSQCGSCQSGSTSTSGCQSCQSGQQSASSSPTQTYNIVIPSGGSVTVSQACNPSTSPPSTTSCPAAQTSP